ncbi:MAG: hypothetical protein II393_01565 [Cytophagales bacterium]|nr:hypothetical protein [Cytophagales bacterium]MBQ5917779.1 hypothetical protein [Lachnospiraceae bacterium]
MEPQDNVTTNVEQVSTPATEVDESKTDTQQVSTENNQVVTETDSQPEGSTTQVSESDGTSTPTEDKSSVEGEPKVSDEIQKKLDRLAEYEVKEKEISDLKDRLGVKDTIQDNQIFSAQQQLAIVENQAQQEYIRLCNQYGVDYRPDKIDASGKELLEKDPQKFYELRYKLEGLNNQIEAKRQEVETFVQQREFSAAFERNKQVFDASPAISRVVKEYIDAGATPDDIDGIVKSGLSIAQEAYEMGRQAALNEKAKVDPAKVLNNNTISQQSQSTPVVENKPFTLEDIKNMDAATYKAHKAEIDNLFLG